MKVDASAPFRQVIPALCGVVVFAVPALARVEVHVTHVGFPSIGRGDIIRAGCWTPLFVELSLLDQASFDGVLRASQLDTDGDEPYDAVEVHLRAESGGNQRVVLYVPANPSASNGAFSVELRDAEGSAVQVLADGILTQRAAPQSAPEAVGHDDVIVLSVSTATVGKVKELSGLQRTVDLRQAVYVAHISPQDLPEHWIGLDAVDYIVWDDARPESLTARQLTALLEWVHYGGTLLVGASQSATSFALVRPFAAVLPAVVSDIASATNLPVTRKALLGNPVAEEGDLVETRDWSDIPFPTPVPVAVSQARPGARSIARESLELGGRKVESDIVSRRPLGAGHVIFCAVTLHDLFSAPGGAARFFEKLFHFLPAAGNEQRAVHHVSLFNNVANAVGFVRSRSVYLLITVLFSITYVAVATVGSWMFLTARGWRHHSWTALAVLALLAGTGGVMAVGAIRGIGDRLQQVAIIDADAGEKYGRALVFFGLKSGIDKELDLWLPSDGLMAREPDVSANYLRPLPAGGTWRVGAKFADPEEYVLRPTTAEIAGARLRATLKRFEGRWEGPLGGELTGQIAVRDGLITEDSYIINKLGMDLANCRLFHSRLDPGAVASERSDVIYVYDLKTLPGDGSRVYLHPRCYELRGSQTINDLLQQALLRRRHEEWSAPFKGAMSRFMMAGDEAKSAQGQERLALLLLSTIGDFDPNLLAGQWGQHWVWSRDRLRSLDLRDHLTSVQAGQGQAGTMVLVGFAPGGGPIRLFTRSRGGKYAALTPEEEASWCMVRIRLPFTVLDNAQGSSRPAGEARSGSNGS